MADPDWMRFLGCLLVLGAYASLVVRRGTALLGLNALNLFMVASATVSGFFVGTIFSNLPAELSDEYTEVVSYSILGLLAMVGGVAVGSRPSKLERERAPHVRRQQDGPSHINEQTGWLTFCVGAAAEVVAPFVSTVPTLSTAVYCLSSLARIGLSVLLVSAIGNGRWKSFHTALGLFALLSFLGSLASGFTFLRFNAIVPLLVIQFVGTGLTIGNVLRAGVLLPVSCVALVSASTAWLQTRQMIRGGSLLGLPLIEQASSFVRDYIDNLSLPSPDSVIATIWYRVDMTNILAAQVRHQPAVEPYAHGATVLSSLYTLIPRALWSDKPVVAGGSAFVHQFSGLSWDATTSVGLPYPFELYANGGPYVVVVGLGVIGYVCGCLEQRLMRPQASLGSFWALALVTAVLTEGGQRADVVLPALVASGLSAYALGRLFERLQGTKFGAGPSPA